MHSQVGKLALLLVLIAALGAWGAGGLPFYALTALVAEVPGQSPYACLGARILEGPPGCAGSGPLILGLDMASFPHLVRQRNGTIEIALRMVGSWDGRALSLSQPPAMAAQDDIRQPEPCTGNPGLYGAIRPEDVRDIGLLESVHVLGWGACDGSIAFTVWVADAHTVTALINRYPGAEVAGWMQPISRS